MGAGETVDDDLAQRAGDGTEMAQHRLARRCEMSAVGDIENDLGDIRQSGAGLAEQRLDVAHRLRRLRAGVADIRQRVIKVLPHLPTQIDAPASPPRLAEIAADLLPLETLLAIVA